MYFDQDNGFTMYLGDTPPWETARISLKVNNNPNQKHPGCKKSCGQELKKGHVEKMWNQKMGYQGQRSDSADGNKILIITIQATKYYFVAIDI